MIPSQEDEPMNLPEAFVKRMETLLGDEFPAFPCVL